MKFGTVKETPEKPVKWLIYGQGGVGKSTLAMDAPGAHMIPVEQGASWIYGPKTEQPRTFDDLLGILDSVPDGLPHLVIDTLDATEQLVWDMVASKAGKPSIGAIAYQVGYEDAIAWWWKFYARLDSLVNRGISVILVAHSGLLKHKDPNGDEWDRASPRLHKKAADLAVEWVDNCLYLKFDDTGEKSDKKGKMVGGTGRDRLICACHSAGYRAKSRTGLPAVQALAIADPWKALEREPTESLLSRVAPDVAKTAREFLAENPKREEAIRKRLTEILNGAGK